MNKSETGPRKYEALRTYMRPRGQDIYDAVGILLQMYRTLTRTEAHAMVLMTLYTMPLIFTTDLLSPDYANDDDPNVFFAPGRILRGTLNRIDSPMCGRTLCPNADTKTTAALSLCAGCRLVRYCSVVCQKEAWVWKPAPHKVVCRDFAKLAMVNGAASSDADFERRLEAGGFGDTKIRDMILTLSMPQQAAMDRIFSDEVERTRKKDAT